MWPGDGVPVVGLGCMRLSTDPGRDEARGIAVLHAAFDAGVNLLDTADAYCHDEHDTGHNERLIARAIASWRGDRSRIRVATKGGLTRPRGAWMPDGRARHLVEAAEASRRALGVEGIDLYQLHAPDPRVPLSTSVRALDALKRDGVIAAIGLSNVTVGQIEEARRITEIASVQVELSPWQDAAILGGVADYCATHDILLLAYRPVGGPQRRKRAIADTTIAAVALRHGATPFEIAIAWLRDLSRVIVPIPGPSRVETVHSIACAYAITLTDEDRAQLDERFPAGRILRRSQRRSPPDGPPQGPLAERPPVERQDAVVDTASDTVVGTAVGAAAVGVATADVDIVLIMGLPGAGKSTLAATYVAQGYTRLNRDEAGGTLAGLLPALDRAIADGSTRIVLDNTYVSRRSRAAVIEAARQRGLLARCVWLATSVEDAQVNAVTRLLSQNAPFDTKAFRPNVQFRYQRELEPPDAVEGFTRIDVVPFERRRDPSFTNRALILWGDEILWRSRSDQGQRTLTSADDLEALADRGALLRRYRDEGWLVLGMSWRPEIADGTLSADTARAAFTRMQSDLGIAIEIDYCPHGAGPPTCWCRKPLPGLGVQFIRRHRLDAGQCLYVGAGPQDPGFARRLGFQYRDANDFFPS
jgi:aryl-alcohol dehydrogenase-like predicted oxidoreductase/predicted kinase/histidinol phosphatase-like enzyme